MSENVLGIDVGTTSVKFTIASDEGKILGEYSRPCELISKEAGFAEENANEWWKNVKSLLSEISAKKFSKKIVSIGVTGMVPTLILVDSGGKPLRNSIQQNDARATREIELLKGKIKEDEYFPLTANTINQQIIPPKYLWLRKYEPDNVNKARWIMGSYDFISYKLTSVPHVEMNWALESGMWLVKEKKWHDEILKLLQIQNLLPPVLKPTDIVGKTTFEIEKETGFPSGIPVVAGSADHIASALAAGVRYEGDLLLKFGGAGDIMFVTDTLRPDRRLFLDYHDIPGKYILNGCMASSGSVVKWFINECSPNTNLDELTRLARRSGVGSQGLLMLPYFLGEKTPIFDTKARGVVFGLDLHHKNADLFRAILESVAFGFKHHIDVIKDMEFKVKRVMMSDGGAKNPLWRQIVVDVIGKDATYIHNHPGSSLGAAFIAGMATGVFKKWSDIDMFLTEKEDVKTNIKDHLTYEKYYKLYRDLYIALKPFYRELYSIKEEWDEKV